MKPFGWDDRKNEKLKLERGVSFELAVEEIRAKRSRVLEGGRPGQYRVLVKLNGYPCVVVAEERDSVIWLVTVFPDRRHKERVRDG